MTTEQKLLDLLRKHETVLLERTTEQGLEVVTAKVYVGSLMFVAAVFPEGPGFTKELIQQLYHQVVAGGGG